jgi:hypothetical protein
MYYAIVTAVLTLLNQGNLTYVTILKTIENSFERALSIISVLSQFVTPAIVLDSLFRSEV